MTTAQAILLGACLIVGAILAHAWTTQPPRYSFTVTQGVQRLDVRTGEIVQCQTGYTDGNKMIFTCESREE